MNMTTHPTTVKKQVFHKMLSGCFNCVDEMFFLLFFFYASCNKISLFACLTSTYSFKHLAII